MRMTGLKRYLALILVAVFAVTTTAAVAMAHCDNSAAGRETQQIDRKMDGCSHSHSTEEKNHADHNNAGEKIPENSHTGDATGHSSDDANQQTSCTNCDAGLCKTQNIVNAETTTAFVAPSTNLHKEKDINLTPVFLSIIPEPPNSIC